MNHQLRRAVLQQLQDYRRCGLTFLPRGIAADAVSADSTVNTDTVPEHQVAAAPTPDANPAAPASMTDVNSVPATPADTALFDTEQDSGMEPRPRLSREQRARQLQTLAERVAQCTRCRELAETRTQTVFGVGNPEARLMFIGEAPGADEDRQGIPFVGRAGQLLDKIIAACQLEREDIYICNILRCRPPGNRNPTSEEAANCREYLDGQIHIVNPEYIVCWGSIAAMNLLDVQTPIGRMRNQFHHYGQAKVVCTYHPSYLLRNPAAKKDVWDDMKFLFRDMGVELR